MEFSPKYTVSLSGKDFRLDQSQVEFDSPNYFTACFLGDFHEAQTRRIELSRDPDIFHLIASYLSGYSVLPLTDKKIPATMSPASTLYNLRADARFYQLQGLVKECDRFMNHTGIKNIKDNRFLVIGAKAYHNNDEMDSMEDYDYDPIRRIPTRANWRTYVTEEKLNQEPLNQLTTPQSAHGSRGLKMKSVVEGFVRSSIKDYRPLHWKLVGWWSKEQNERVNTVSELLVVVEDLKRASGNTT
ncbi:unnamed protein product [Rhizoctonia solani]|uniref:BTB domain protein, putative n=2 Tax=Rhizoctonia solani AG-3 TaxID=1086053 RepID=A0A0A1UJ36_9AGAM|nr:BTB domain protein, putative [Rhizoctonia solani AG-3 Rhs1AP]KEP51286.1 putative BTB domain protein [Rhizoctonia solani 123E]CAE6456201.1 unnamed protein product [Rhizoctonia solani]